MNYLHIAVYLVFFYDAIILLLLPSTSNLIFAPDGSAARYIVNILCVSAGMYALMTKGFKVLPNKALAGLLLVMVISAAHSPNISFESTFIPKDSGIYNYKPMLESVLLFLLFMGVYSIELTEKVVARIIKSLAWVGTIYGAYILFQKAGLDQFYVINGELNHLSRNPEAGAFICQPVYAAAIMAICLPFVIKEMCWWKILVCILGIVLTGNRMAILASAFSYWYLVGSLISERFRSQILICALALAGVIVAIVTLSFFYPDAMEKLCFTGRLEVWRNVLLNIAHCKFPGINHSFILTGYGIGAFPVLFPFYNNSGFYQAHNEYLECFFCLGITGFILFAYFLHSIFKTQGDSYIGAALLACAICALFNPVWHIPQIQFITVILLALYYKRSSYVEIGNSNGCSKHRQFACSDV